MHQSASRSSSKTWYERRKGEGEEREEGRGRGEGGKEGKEGEEGREEGIMN